MQIETELHTIICSSELLVYQFKIDGQAECYDHPRLPFKQGRHHAGRPGSHPDSEHTTGSMGVTTYRKDLQWLSNLILFSLVKKLFCLGIKLSKKLYILKYQHDIKIRYCRRWFRIVPVHRIILTWMCMVNPALDPYCELPDAGQWASRVR